MKSTAAVAHSLRAPFVVEDVELPDLQDTDVLVRIVAVGVCHTDIASRDGQLPAPFPAIFGHEGAGVVERVGARVRKVMSGDHVVLAPVKLLGPLGCGIQTGAGTVMNGLRPQPGSAIAILGCGAVGLAAILGSVVSGCATIIAVDRNDDKLELARRLGATHSINTTRTPELGSALRDIAHRGVNFVVDAAGVDTLIGMAITGLARRGTIGLVAVPPSPERTLNLPWASLLLQGQAVQGFMEGNSIPDIFIPRMIELHAQGRFPFDKFVRYYPFREINRAIEDQRNGSAIKPILEVSAS